MLPSLILVDIAVFFFYLSQGAIKSKIRADLEIIKNRRLILKRYKEIQSRRIIDDKEIINGFQDEVFVPKEVANKATNKIFNIFIKALSRCTRRFI